MSVGRMGVSGGGRVVESGEVVVICREKIRDLPRADRIRAWRRCLEEYLMR